MSHIVTKNEGDCKIFQNSGTKKLSKILWLPTVCGHRAHRRTQFAIELLGDTQQHFWNHRV